ncbi:MAG: mandelate racemase/muconate lactonizing enzyme family protein [Bacteroidales bacterium]
MNRRELIKTGMGAGALTLLGCSKNQPGGAIVDYDILDEAASSPVLKRELFPDPVIIESMELLHFERNYMIRVRSAEGAIGYGVSNNLHSYYLYPILIQRVIPLLIGKDARDLDNLVEDVYTDGMNYKLQGLALWIPLATAEIAILDMLGRIAGKSITELIGERHHNRVALYQANSYRGIPAGESVGYIKENVANSKAKALKIRLGAEMGKNVDSLPGRTEELIPLVRETFGDEMVLYADANGCYDRDKGIEVGRLLEEYKYAFYEEPCRYDWLVETKEVADALDIPIAGGEQDGSMWRFRWMIANGCIQVVQPDLFYFGGFVRCTRVARMAAAANLEVVSHISGFGLGNIYNLLFVASLPNAGLYHEFKGNPYIPVESTTSSLQSKDGEIAVPTGPGSGLIIDPDFIDKHEIATSNKRYW